MHGANWRSTSLRTQRISQEFLDQSQTEPFIQPLDAAQAGPLIQTSRAVPTKLPHIHPGIGIRHGSGSDFSIAHERRILVLLSKLSVKMFPEHCNAPDRKQRR